MTENEREKARKNKRKNERKIDRVRKRELGKKHMVRGYAHQLRKDVAYFKINFPEIKVLVLYLYLSLCLDLSLLSLCLGLSSSLHFSISPSLSLSIHLSPSLFLSLSHSLPLSLSRVPALGKTGVEDGVVGREHHHQVEPPASPIYLSVFIKGSHERPTRGRVISTLRKAAHPSGCARCGAGTGSLAIKYQSI